MTPPATRGAGPSASEGDGVVDLVAPPLTLRFQWDGARWAHALSLDGRESPVAATVEWEAGRDDPRRVVSPAYQQIGCDEPADEARALVVGQWGPYHGSGAFVARREGSGVTIDVDVAVRGTPTVETLAATYLVEFTSGDLRDANPSSIAWGIDGPAAGTLYFEPGTPDDHVAFAEAGRRATRVQAIRPVDTRLTTQRLHYRWRWERGPA